MTISLAQNAARVSYSVSEGATQTSFTVSFEFFDDADLNVYVDGTKKTLTTHYSVSGGSGSTGAVAISVTGATGGSTVVITRDIALARTTDFPTSGSFQIATLNTELDRFTAIAADLKDSVDRSLQLTDYDAAATLVLPAVDDRKGKALIFNSSSGNVEAAFQVTAAAVNVSTLDVGASATASVAVSDGTATFALGIPTGATGATGAPGAAGGGMANVVEDTSPQLGGNLDTNSQNILIDDAHFIGDESGNEQIVFQTTGSAVNHLEITNNASGSNPILSAAGDDTNIGIALTPKGTGEIVIAAGNLNYGGTAVSSTGAELNYLDALSRGSLIYGNASAATAVLTKGGAGTVLSSDGTDISWSAILTNAALTGTPVEDIYALSGTSVALEPDNGSIQTHTLSGSTTYSDAFSAGQGITLMIDDGSAQTVSWPTMTWVNNGGAAPTLATSGYTVISIWKVSSTLYGALVGDGS